MKQKLLIVGLPLALALASASADAATRSYSHSGVQCAQAVSSMSNITRDQYGVHNTSLTEGLTVECPVNVSYFASNVPTIFGFGIQVYNRNPSADVSCNLQRTDGNGNVTYNTNLTTNGSGAAVQGLGVFPSGVLVDGVWRLRCWLPPAASANNFNHILNYGISINE